jgi:outer membrane protease
MKRIASVVLAVAACLSFASAAQANRNRDATLEVSSSAVVGAAAPASAFVVGSNVVFAGCGYAPGVGVTIAVLTPTAYTFFGAVAGNDGCFSTAGRAVVDTDTAGTYHAQTWQSNSRHADAELDFVVS